MNHQLKGPYNMNSNEFTQLLKQAQALGLKTVGELANFTKAANCKTNNDLLNAVNRAYCTRGAA